jgi:nicotinate-nucleotide adenylyltransferase
MIKLAIEESDNFYIDDYEVYSSNLSYTVDSIKRISKVLPENSELYFIIGADSLLYLDRWYDAQTLLDITNFVVIPREGYKKDDCENKIEQLKLEYNARITYINCKPIQLSSTSIRKSIVNDEYKNLSVNKKVIRYIKENRLYKNV